MPTLKPVFESLESRYTKSSDASVMISSSGALKYALNPIKKSHFAAYNPFAVPAEFRVAATDSGSLLIYETAGWSLGYCKYAFRTFQVSVQGKNCNTVQETRHKTDELVLIVNGEGRDTEQVVHKNARTEAETALNEYRARKETDFILDKLGQDHIQKADTVFVDGTLEQENARLLEKHENIVGVSKRSFLSIGGHGATPYFARLASNNGTHAKPWFYYPLVKDYPERAQFSELIFGTFRPNSVVFRVDFPRAVLQKESNPAEIIQDSFQKLGVCSLDAKYKSYPYPLGAVHTDAVMRSNTKDRLRRFVREELNKHKVTSDSEALELIAEDMHHAEWYDALRKFA